ncbi:hypothetical protein PILCRDRAFT_13333 [Piloderma croceum F 1598]|uniref:CHAT domain-containing protein n=1 Tax=Piloderma croceum (strain F 1598) TaxID=765440 RepID=A0A0C3AP78_PILCF|nr:hypothetical protein PILCRDRAFT_13333 [Piloderma croceum F 1598]
MDDSHPNKVRYLRSLGIALQTRFECLGEQADFVVCVTSFRAAAQLKAAYPYQALSASRQWAKASYLNGDLMSALEGYRTALELLPKVVWLGLDTSLRQDWLLGAESEALGCLAATCAIRLGHLEEAVELLDLGRSVFWRQASSLRSDLQKLNEDEPELSEKLERVGRQLDAGNFSDSAFTIGAENIGNDRQRTPKDVVRERRLLVAEWEELVERVRQLPQFKYFLRPIPFCQLRQVSVAGQVVIINASGYGVDALIFGNTGPIEHVSLPHINLEILTNMSSNIVLERPINASATQRRNYTTRFLKPALRTVWNNILVHIFEKIHIPLVDNSVLPQRRIWWYPTGPLTFIPIHAAGLGSRVDASRLVISSYVTTLGSHSQAQNKYQRISQGQNKLLTVSQTATPGQSSLPKTMEEVDEVALVFCSSGWSEQDIVSLRGPDATVNAVSSALNLCSWVHFACHGSQDPKLGMKSAFSLHDGQLELSEIATKKISYGQFAFLSACQAASGLKDLPGEAMHLAAGLQFAGFPSVIATMWGICDNDAPTVADHTYQYLFRNGLQGLDPSEAATALNRAVLRFREDPSIMLDQWAPFIHFGI